MLSNTKVYNMLMVGFPGGTVVGSICQSRTPGDSGDAGLIPGSGRSTGVGNGNLFQYSKNPLMLYNWKEVKVGKFCWKRKLSVRSFCLMPLLER